MGMNVFELADEYKQAERDLNEMLALEQIDEQTITDTLDGLRGGLEEKFKNIALYMGNIKSSAQSIKEQEKLMSVRRKRLEDQHAKMNKYLKAKMEECEITRIECPYFVMSIQKNPASLKIDDEKDIPEDYKSYETVCKIDKARAKSDLKDGIRVFGARLESGTRLVIK